jgi:hypothetical protein
MYLGQIIDLHVVLSKHIRHKPIVAIAPAAYPCLRR